MNRLFVFSDDEGFFIAAFDSLEKAQEYKDAYGAFGGDIEEVELNPIYKKPISSPSNYSENYIFKRLIEEKRSDALFEKYPEYSMVGLIKNISENNLNQRK